MLDTDILVDLMRGFAPAVTWLECERKAPVVSGIAALELLHGCKTLRDARLTRDHLSVFTLLWPEKVVYQAAFRMFPELRLSHGCSLNDIVIAQQALHLGATLCTFNVKHYRVFHGLDLAQPYWRN